MRDVYRGADRLLLAVLACCVGVAVGLGLYFGGLPLALGAGLPLVAIAAGLVAWHPGGLATRLVVPATAPLAGLAARLTRGPA